MFSNKPVLSLVVAAIINTFNGQTLEWIDEQHSSFILSIDYNATSTSIINQFTYNGEIYDLIDSIQLNSTGAFSFTIEANMSFYIPIDDIDIVSTADARGSDDDYQTITKEMVDSYLDLYHNGTFSILRDIPVKHVFDDQNIDTVKFKYYPTSLSVC